MADEKSSGGEQEPVQHAQEARERKRGPHHDRVWERLKAYPVSRDDVHSERVVVPPKMTLRIDARDKAKGVVPLRPSSIDDVKSWIGTRDEVVRQGCIEYECPPNLTVSAEPAAVGDMTPEARNALWQLGQAYVYGDSERVKNYKTMFEPLLSKAVITGIFILPDIDVYGTLELGASIKVLWANKIRIWPGGLVRLTGNAKIDAFQIEVKTKYEIEPWMVDFVPQIGTLLRLEAENA